MHYICIVPCTVYTVVDTSSDVVTSVWTSSADSAESTIIDTAITDIPSSSEVRPLPTFDVMSVPSFVWGEVDGYVVYRTRISYRTRMVHTVRVKYVPYAYGMIFCTIRVWLYRTRICFA